LRSQPKTREARLAEVSGSLEALRNPVRATEHSVTVVPIQSLQLARAQFGFLADGFARSGDVVSQTICEIGAGAIEIALAGYESLRKQESSRHERRRRWEGEPAGPDLTAFPPLVLFRRKAASRLNKRSGGNQC
jgi:hypothetical protein